MAKRMLIDAAHPEETRVVALSGNRLEEFDFESSTKRQVKGNIYLAKVTRVEPSLQAAFVDYGGNRHGFLAFSEIHPDYYRIPVSDRSPGNGEPHDTPEQLSVSGTEEIGVPIGAALPEPVPVPGNTGGDDTAVEEEPAARDAALEENVAETRGDHVAENCGYEPAAPTEPVHAGPFDSVSPAEWERPDRERSDWERSDWERPDWERPDWDKPERETRPAESAPEPPAEPERPEPERASWHDEAPFHSAPPSDGQSGDSTAPWSELPADYAQADHAEHDEARPEAIALRASEESIVAAEIGDVPLNGDAAEPASGTVETLGGDEVEEVEEADAERRRRYP